jgi:hypothetical protein
LWTAPAVISGQEQASHEALKTLCVVVYSVQLSGAVRLERVSMPRRAASCVRTRSQVAFLRVWELALLPLKTEEQLLRAFESGEPAAADADSWSGAMQTSLRTALVGRGGIGDLSDSSPQIRPLLAWRDELPDHLMQARVVLQQARGRLGQKVRATTLAPRQEERRLEFGMSSPASCAGALCELVRFGGNQALPP